MKSFKKTHFLSFGLTLLLSLVSFSNGIHQSYTEEIKTELVVNDTTHNSRFSIQFQKVDKIVLASLFSYSYTSFCTFKTAQNLKDNTSFKTFTHKTLSVNTEQLQNKLYASLNQKTLYEDSIV